jgi:hypothetical protein
MALIGLYDLCSPAKLYLLLSLTVIVVVALQNLESGSRYCVGTLSCSSSTTVTTGFFFIKVLYVLVWTWIINIFCQNGQTVISWVLVLIPLLTMFIFMALFISVPFDWGFLVPNIHMLN